MLPSILAKQLQEGLIDYIDTTFPITNSVFKDSLSNMLHTENAIFHEPYIAVSLPFRVYDGKKNFFEAIHQPYSPYVHQQRAFERLSVEDGMSTLVATGTGSGKTECFLYPILEYCYRHRGEKGIKALIIYPMNALASDQAKRIAELVDTNPKLKDNQIRVGMYVGGQEKNATKMMLPEKVITDHETLIASPPDILMTNYKMLDYLLVRPKDAELWKFNQPETLKYIAVDELHTFDGAQGTDLACLLRRLKARLNILPGQLCCIGTSATMGAKESEENIRQYATDVFGEIFEEDAVITEDRLAPEEFFVNYEVNEFQFPTEEQVQQLTILSKDEDEIAYLIAAESAWFSTDNRILDIMSDNGRVELGKHLMSHYFMHDLLSEAHGQYIQSSTILEILKVRHPEINSLGMENACEALGALYALISHARIYDIKGKLRPFLNVQVQLWMRELRRLMAKVDDSNIQFALATDLNEQQSKQYLPVVNCRDCGQTGWASIMDEQGSVQLSDLNTFYNLYFDGSSKIRMVFPHRPDEKSKHMKMLLCSECLEIAFEERQGQLCSNGHQMIPVWLPDLDTSGRGRGKSFICPFCGSQGGLAIMGLRSATAISAGISELYASRFNDDKKLLAFTDNVQDAAHHAGFYNAKTWRFMLRTAMQQFAQTTHEDYSLKYFIEACVSYWKEKMSKEQFVATFIPSNLIWMRAYEKMCLEGSLKDDADAKSLLEFVSKRMAYEAMLEYGLSARIGRSLEKSGCSVISFEFEKALPNIIERIKNEENILQNADADTFIKMITGFLYGMKLNGAFYYKDYDSFIKNNGIDFILNRIKWMPGARKGRNVPKFVAINKGGKQTGYFDQPSDKSWYGKWINKYLPIMHPENISIAISKIILEELTKAEILTKCDGPENLDVWAINPEKCFISRKVKQMVCDVCGSKISIAENNVPMWDGICCTRIGCQGHMRQMSHVGLDFYGKLYSKGELIRIVAKEHTGLLERDARETLENTFKKKNEEKKPWDANLLSCTPTLEMGIDIGDLSTVILCSIPPAQSQYAQRAGRGGRTDGNALTIAVANAKPHDLFFYADPLEMIAGAVQPPKVFLRASAVLSRQFVAYCMDCWVKSEQAIIPKNVGACLTKLNNAEKNTFPNNFLRYVQNNLTKLIRMFTQTFSVNVGSGDGLDSNAISEIKAFALGNNNEKSPMHMKIYEAFASLKEQKRALQTSVKDLRAMIKELENKPKDSSYTDEINELKSECGALLHVIHSINDKDVFNFLSDEGLLPNYAFPEAGIILKAVLYRTDEDSQDKEVSKKRYEKMVYEYNRSASAAISEFAPLNNFYVDGKKLKIDQIDINTTHVAKWRLCPNCAHAELEDVGKSITVCPECQSPGWADSGQVRSMLKVQMVYSNMMYKESFMSDEGDDRNTVFYDKEMLVDVDEDHDILKAYKMDNSEFPFGYEFVKKATMREINFGEKDIVGDKLTIAGVENIRTGFTICKYCGKIQEHGKKPAHAKYCKVSKAGNEFNDSYEECLFLYREFQTEALRILIPATTMNPTKVRVESFVAAFMLGMKSYFGNVDHLRACVSEVPVPDSDYRKQYLVIYDSVPGGTGYLKQLMNNKHGLIEILEHSLNIMEHCTCKDDLQKDGCYRCLYAYRQSQHIGEISRRVAVSILKTILSGKNNLEEIPKLGNISVGGLFESELERHFIEAMHHLGKNNREVEVHQSLVNEKPGYTLRVGPCLWDIELQVELDDRNGIPVSSRADFVLYPKRTTGDQKPVVIFTDGFTFHKDKVDDDTLKRMAIMQTKQYRVWSLTWKDVQHIFMRQGDYKTNTLIPERMPMGPRIYYPTIKAAHAEDIHPDKENAFELLMDYLATPNAEQVFTAHATAFCMSIMNASLQKNQQAYDMWYMIWRNTLNSMDAIDEPEPFGKVLFGMWEPRETQGNIDILAMMSIEDMKLKMNAPMTIMAILNDKEELRTEKYDVDWNGFWHFVNVMQFTKNAIFVSAKGIENAIYTVLNSSSIADVTTEMTAVALLESEDPEKEKWNEYMEQEYFIDDLTKACVSEMISKGIPAPSIVGEEIIDKQSGKIIAMAEMAWENMKIVWLSPEQEEYTEAFVTNGWKVLLSRDCIKISDFGGDINE